VRSVLDARVWSAATMFVLAAGVVWRSRLAAWPIALGVIWFFAALLPSSVLMLLDRGEPMAEHRVYLASCGFFLAAGTAMRIVWMHAERIVPRGEVLAGAALTALLLPLSIETTVRNAIWRDPVTLWREAVNLAPSDYRPRLLLGEALQDAGLKADALDEFKTAMRLAPGQADGYVKAGLCLISMGRLQDARPYLQDALARDAANEPARRGLALLASLQ
jgi:tetratricopeptide (TPR) repeat protein